MHFLIRVYNTNRIPVSARAVFIFFELANYTRVRFILFNNVYCSLVIQCLNNGRDYRKQQ